LLSILAAKLAAESGSSTVPSNLDNLSASSTTVWHTRRNYTNLQQCNTATSRL